MNNKEQEDFDDIFKGFGIRIKLLVDFVKIREVLSRIGIANSNNKTLTQTAHIFHKRGNYALMHFKEMFMFDGKSAEYTEQDESRRNRIIRILEEWKMIEIDDDISEEFPVAPPHSVTILSRAQKMKEEWKLVSKYTLGKKGQA